MSPSRGPALINADGSCLQDPIIGMGESGMVVQRDDAAIKLLLLHSTIGLCEDGVDYFHACNLNARDSLCHEKEVYRRLGQSKIIVCCLDLSGSDIQMVLMTN